MAEYSGRVIKLGLACIFIRPEASGALGGRTKLRHLDLNKASARLSLGKINPSFL